METKIIKDVPANIIELLNGIAQKENGIKNIIDKETVKIQKVLGKTDDFDKILEINDSVKNTINSLKQTEETTKNNLENILNMLNS